MKKKHSGTRLKNNLRIEWLDYYYAQLWSPLLSAASVESCLIQGHDERETVPPWVEPVVVISVLILNGCIGIYQDYNAEKATEALKKLQSDSATVLREGGWRIIKSNDLVPGDIINVKIGDKVPADARLVKMKTLSLTVN